MFFSLNGIETTDFYEFKEWSDLNFPTHCHYSLEIGFLISGKIYMTVGEKTHLLSPGDACISMPLEKHAFHTPENSSSEVIIFQISPQLISDWNLCFKGKKFNNPVCRFSDEEIKEIAHILKNTDGNLIELNYVFFRIMNKYISGNELSENYETDNICTEALLYVSKNYTTDIALKTAASALGVSTVYLSRIFSKKIKIRFVDCVNSFRIQKAVSLLADRKKNISEICYECGFGSVRQFNRIFKETFGKNPGEYRAEI